MLIENNNKNIFQLLIILINSVFVLSYNEEFPFYEPSQKNILINSCNEINKIFCPMTSAIEDIFTSIQTEEIIADNNDYYYNIYIQYHNIYARDIICENIDITPKTKNEEKDSYSIIFNNCNVLIEGKISYKNEEVATVDFGPFLSELKIDSITFSNYKSDKEIMRVEFKNSTQKYNYNRKEAIFSSGISNMTEQMDDLMDIIYDKYINLINDKIETNRDRNKILYDTINDFSNNFSYFPGLGLFNEIKNVSYIYYTNFNYEYFIHIKNKIFFDSMNVNFEYALNNNITYNEGKFVINNFIFEKDTSKDNNYNNSYLTQKEADFNNLDNKDNIWDTILNDFKSKLNYLRK